MSVIGVVVQSDAQVLLSLCVWWLGCGCRQVWWWGEGVEKYFSHFGDIELEEVIVAPGCEVGYGLLVSRE